MALRLTCSPVDSVVLQPQQTSQLLSRRSRREKQEAVQDQDWPSAPLMEKVTVSICLSKKPVVVAPPVRLCVGRAGVGGGV